jgi:hypothetical protein
MIRNTLLVKITLSMEFLKPPGRWVRPSGLLSWQRGWPSIRTCCAMPAALLSPIRARTLD